ncbi:MAG: DUF4105 domain-containing protein [Luteolibacter sp.]|uniref:Lnb N-terminal periplasmic domain-containing protein n=1 Tax=Luteolibacter sp. TaxID=1962973 RepID=UPI003266123D
MFSKFLRSAGRFLVCLIGVVVILWAMGALWFDLPLDPLFRKIVAVLFFAVAVFFWCFGKGRIRLAAPALTVLVAVWWFTLKPSNTRDWISDVGETAWADLNGDEITFHNVRNFDYRTEADYTPHWDTRTVRLSKITGVDMAINYWGSPYMAHPIVSFQFSDAPPLCFSIETRKEKGESYSAIGGIYRQYELIYVVADERDVIRVRTNYRKGEDIYLYRMKLSAKQARGRFMDYVKSLNELKDKAKWYNAVTDNCTTSIRTQQDKKKRRPWDWRILVNGFGDEMLYENGSIETGGLPFPELKKRSLINEAAKAADAAPDFTRLIRLNVPSFSDPTLAR